MKKQPHDLTVFEGQKIRRIWDEENELWYFSVVDVARVLTNSIDAGAYWRKLKQRLKEEGSEVVTKCHELKFMAKDGKFYLTDAADTETMFRIIQSIPSPKAEPFKLWLAREGGGIAGNARKQIEAKTGEPVISRLSFRKMQEQKKLKGT